ncbi:MAG TPA: TcpQ domain-containing protein [Burkholderiaceae bacterium]|nr:TcpQ domain-containing protein [Burkholderiaceae bacterium]
MILLRALFPLMLLSGCTGPHADLSFNAWQWPFAAGAQHSEGSDAHGGSSGYRAFSFEWALSGDPQIMPVQVFDDGERMWLQFGPEGAWPAVFDADGERLRPLSYRREPPYMVLDGVYTSLELRGGHLRGRVQSSRNAVHGEDEALLTDSGVPDGAGVAEAVAVPTVAQVAAVQIVAEASAMAVPALRVPGTGPAPVTAAPASYLGAPLYRYSVSPADQTIRQALERWAGVAGWSFSAEHWAVDVDIPLVGQASFDADFQASVRALLEATELGDRPLQPCFYSNRVLRVVPYAQPCDRRGTTRAVS